MDVQYKTKSQPVVAYKWEGGIFESNEVPSVPQDLYQRFPGYIRMQCVGKVTHGGPLQWMPFVWGDGGSRHVQIRPGSWIVQHQNSRIYVMTDAEFHQFYEPVTPGVFVSGNGGSMCDATCPDNPHWH